jgi:hypothetical protein
VMEVRAKGAETRQPSGNALSFIHMINGPAGGIGRQREGFFFLCWTLRQAFG